MNGRSMRTRNFIAIFVLSLAAWLGLPRVARQAVQPSALAAGTTFTVNVTGDGQDANPGDGICQTGVAGNCSLRAAIQEANAKAGADTINFNIAGGGVHTITPNSALPGITEAVIIDGYSQPGSSQNTLVNGDNAVLLIELNGSSAGTSFIDGLLLFASGCTIRGLVINRFSGLGIDVQPGASNTIIEGNFIGTNPAGNGALGNQSIGIGLASNNSTIGGASPAARNVVSGNGSGTSGGGIGVFGTGCSVQGNYIGTDAGGTISIANMVNGGVFIGAGGSNNTIGGTVGGARNVISGNSGNGVWIPDASNNLVRGNYIGTNVNGTAALPNTLAGVSIGNLSGSPNFNVIGGTSVGTRNIISGNLGSGVEIVGEAIDNQVQGNYIGTDASGTASLGNAVDGVRLATDMSGGAQTLVGGSPAASCDASGNGEGQTFVGSISKSTGAGGHLNLGPALVSGIVPGLFVTATATTATQAKDTSEFSPCVQVTGSFTSTLQFSTGSFNPSEGIGFETLTVNRTGDTSGTVTVDFATSDSTAEQRTDYTITSGTLSFGPGETSKTVAVLIVDDNYVEGNESFRVALSNPTGGAVLGGLNLANVTIVDNDVSPPLTNPLDTARFFVQQHYYDFLSRYPDQGGWDFWTSQITQCGSDPVCLRAKRIDVSNSFFYELEYQQTGAYVFRLYRAAFGNNQPFPNPDGSNQTESKKLPAYAVFASDRARVVGGANLAQGQQNLANAFVQRSEFIAKYPSSQDGPTFVDVVLATIRNDTGVNLASQRTALINLFNSGGRGAVLYRLADDNQSNPINNRLFIDEEYNRAFVATEYFGYLRRDADISGFLFWLGQVNSGPLRDTTKQHAMVCSFITSSEYQQRFSSVVMHSNSECQ